MSFTERKTEQLRDERNPRTDGANFDGAPSNLNQAELPDPQPAHQPENDAPVESIDPAFAETPEQPTLQPEGVETLNVESEPEDPEIYGLRQRAEQAETQTQSMQADYTQKTQKLAEQRRELVTELEQSTRIAEMYAQRANQNLSRYDGVNWQQLQSTQDPQTYSSRVAEYRQAVQMRDQAVSEHERIAEMASTHGTRQKDEQAEVSRDILKNTVPNWGNELYGSLREHAVTNMQFTAAEFDEFVDHRIITMIHNDWQLSNAGKTVTGIQHNGSQSRPSGQNMPQRSPDGKFRKAQEAHVRNPGDRNATREAFRQRLSNERGRGR